MTRFFFYGTLMAPGVLSALTGTRATFQDAILSDHAVVGLRDRVYPGLLPRPGDLATGVVAALDERAARIVREFEDGFYEEVVVPVTIGADDGCLARCFRLSSAAGGLTVDTPWSLEAFCRRQLADYTAMCVDFGRQFPPP